MSNVSIYEKNWTDLVFEDRNKEYGAYQLRNESGRTTMLAFFIGILFIFSLIGSWILLSSFGKNPETGLIADPEIKITPVTLTDMPQPKEPVAPKAPQVENQIPKEPTNLSNMVVVATSQAQVDVPTNAEVDNRPNVENGSPTGTVIDAPATTTAAAYTPAKGPEKVMTTVELDRLPEYPGGIKKFYEYVGNSIEKSELEDSSSSISVIVGFVIEKDGSMSDIKILRGSDKKLEKEAIRVLRSLRVKWSPGYLDGDKVRTQYTLPIKVAN